MNILNKVKELSLRAKLITGAAVAIGGNYLFEVLNNKPTVSVITLQGTILAGKTGFNTTPPINLENTRKMIDSAFKQRNLKAVLLSVNSPGGSAVQSDLVSSYIKAKAEKAGVEVIVFVEDVAASGGYWLACTGQQIYATRSSVVGSIGVISGGLGFHELIQKYGIERRVFTAGENKSIMDPFSPLKESDVAILKNLLNNIHQHFIDHVKTSRGERLKGGDKVLFNGEFWTGDPAKELGLIDGIDTLDAYVEREYGDKVKVFRAKRSGGLSALLSTFLDQPLSALPSPFSALPSPLSALPSPSSAVQSPASLTDNSALELSQNNLK